MLQSSKYIWCYLKYILNFMSREIHRLKIDDSVGNIKYNDTELHKQMIDWQTDRYKKQ